MKLFKNPVFAVVLCIILIFVSTILSIHIRFGNKADRIKDQLFTGVEVNGYIQKPIAAHLQNYTGYASGLATIAKNYDVDTTALTEANDYLQLSLKYSGDYASSIYYNYTELNKEVNSVVDALQRKELSDRDAEGLEQYVNSIAGVHSSIEESGYNDSVREFLRKYDRFPTNALVTLAGVSMPEYFA